MRETEQRRDPQRLNGSWPAHPCKQNILKHVTFSCSNAIFLSSPWLIMMSPLRCKSSKHSTRHIRSSKYHLSHLPPSQKSSVLLNPLLAIAPSISSVVYRMYTIFRASSIFRPAAFLTYRPPSSYSSAEARSTPRCLHHRHAPQAYKYLKALVSTRRLHPSSSTIPFTLKVRGRVSPRHELYCVLMGC